jgi:hypothetical protein
MSPEQPGVDRVCSRSEARIRGRGQANDPDLDSIHISDLRQFEEHGQDGYSTDDQRFSEDGDRQPLLAALSPEQRVKAT